MSWKMREKYGFLAEDDDLGTGGSGGGDDLDEDLDELPIDDGDNPDEDDEPESVKQLSPDQIASLAAEAAAGVMRKQPQPQKDLTPEELDKHLRRYKVPVDLVAAIRNAETPPEKVVELLQQLVDGTAQHALTASGFLLQDKLSPLQQQMVQQQEFVKEQKTREFVGKVEKNFGALKGYGKVIRQAISHLSSQNYQAPNKSAAIKEVARTAASIIRTINPQFSLKAGGNGNRQAGSFGARRNGGGGGSQTQGGTGVKSFSDLF